MARLTGTERVMLAALILIGIGTAYLLIEWIATGATGAPPSPGGLAIITALGGNFAVHRAGRAGRGLRPLEIALLSVLTGATVVVGAIGIATGDRWEKVWSGAFIVVVLVSIIGMVVSLRKARAQRPTRPSAEPVSG